jgi:hypothetical protein
VLTAATQARQNREVELRAQFDADASRLEADGRRLLAQVERHEQAAAFRAQPVTMDDGGQCTVAELQGMQAMFAEDARAGDPQAAAKLEACNRVAADHGLEAVKA